MISINHNKNGRKRKQASKTHEKDKFKRWRGMLNLIYSFKKNDEKKQGAKKKKKPLSF
jgi:hypothetical protein